MSALSLSALVLLAFVSVQRVVELSIARRHTTALLARGGREVGAAHYPLIVAVHLAWILALVLFGWSKTVSAGWVAAYALLQVLRVWIIASLGERWTTRIIVIDEPAIRRGPYRFVSHPNYWLVAAELVVVPMALGLPLVALAFTLLNAAVMVVRISAENEALARLPPLQPPSP